MTDEESGEGDWQTVSSGITTDYFTKLDVYYYTEKISADDLAKTNKELIDNLGDSPADIDPTTTITTHNNEVENGSTTIVDTSTQTDNEKSSILKNELNQILNNKDGNSGSGGSLSDLVKAFQEAHGINPTGVLDAATLYLLEMDQMGLSTDGMTSDGKVADPDVINSNTHSGDGPTNILDYIDKNYKDNLIKQAQALLDYMGFNIGDEGVDGYAPNPSNSWQAIKTFQDMVGLNHGTVDKSTLDSLKDVVRNNWNINKKGLQVITTLIGLIQINKEYIIRKYIMELILVAIN